MRYNCAMKIKPNTSNTKPQTAASRFPALCLISAFLLLAVAGCKPKAGGNANVDPAGVYTLVSVNGKSVPCNLTHEGVVLTVKSGVFTITADGHCTSQTTFCVSTNRDVNRDVKATYTRNGTELTMRWEGAGMTKGNVNGNTFTMTNEDIVLAYRK